MTNTPPGFRPNITVFGEHLHCVDIRNDVAGHDHIILYVNKSAKSKAAREVVKAASVKDWIQWDRDAKGVGR